MYPKKFDIDECERKWTGSIETSNIELVTTEKPDEVPDEENIILAMEWIGQKLGWLKKNDKGLCEANKEAGLGCVI